MLSSPKTPGITLIAAPNRNKQNTGSVISPTLRERTIASSLSAVKFLTASKDEIPGIREAMFKAVAGIKKIGIATIEITMIWIAEMEPSKKAPADSIRANRILATPSK